MILFVGAIQAIPREIDEATEVDGASAWQRITRVTLPLTMRTILLVTLISVIGSLLAFDQFYIMTAGQPQNLTATSVFYVYLNSFPYLKLGYGAALSLILALLVLVVTVGQVVADAAGATRERGRRAAGLDDPRALARRVDRADVVRAEPVPGRRHLCVAICAVMLAPIVLSVLASLKTTAEAAADPADLPPAAS